MPRFELKHFSLRSRIISVSLLVTILVAITGIYIFNLRLQSVQLQEKNTQLSQDLTQSQAQFTDLQNLDQIVRNNDLEATIKQIEQTFSKSISVYEELQDLKLISKNTTSFDSAFADTLNLLSARNYTSASAQLDKLTTDLVTEKQKAVVASLPTQTTPNSPTAPANNTPPSSGYSRQTVNTDAGQFIVSLIAADLNTTKVIVDTASESDCTNNCPVLSLASYVARSNAYAGVNGSYFCPATYPTCAGKTNTYDLLVMNKNKTYFNSDNNVYSSNPAVIFGNGYLRFVSAVSQWGRDTGVDGVLSNYPLLVHGNNVVFGGNDDPKQGSKGNRSFVSGKGNNVYIGVVHNATVAESARVLKALEMENALNLDNGGSTALWSGGYKLGPGRDLPNAILFVRK